MNSSGWIISTQPKHPAASVRWCPEQHRNFRARSTVEFAFGRNRCVPWGFVLGRNVGVHSSGMSISCGPTLARGRGATTLAIRWLRPAAPARALRGRAALRQTPLRSVPQWSQTCRTAGTRRTGLRMSLTHVRLSLGNLGSPRRLISGGLVQPYRSLLKRHTRQVSRWGYVGNSALSARNPQA